MNRDLMTNYCTGDPRQGGGGGDPREGGHPGERVDGFLPAPRVHAQLCDCGEGEAPQGTAPLSQPPTKVADFENVSLLLDLILAQHCSI